MNTRELLMPAAVATVNGIALHDPAEALSAAQLRSRASFELLRQAAIDAGLLQADDRLPQAGVVSESAADAIETLLDRAQEHSLFKWLFEKIERAKFHCLN